MDTEFDFTDIEAVESVPPETEEIEDMETCTIAGCSEPRIAYKGRGPRPKYCATHKRKSTGRSSRPKKKQGTDYTEGIAGMLQLPATALAIAGSQGDNPKIELLADAKVIADYTPAIASAVNDLAHDRPEVAAVLDKILKVGPYGALLSAIVPMAMQIMANHKMVPVGVMGTVTPERLLGFPQPETPETSEAPRPEDMMQHA